MMIRVKTTFILFVFLFFSGIQLLAQEEIGIYVCGITVHGYKDPNAHLMPCKLTNNGVLLLNFGGAAHYKKYFTPRFSLDAIQTMQADCALLFSSGTAVAVGYDIVHYKGHRVIFAIGPGFYIRQSWKRLGDTYDSSQYDFNVTKNEKWEYMFVPVVPHLEYKYVPENSRFGFTCYFIFDPIEQIYNIGAGITYLLKNK